MDENKMHLINKIFNNEIIRTIWDKEQEKYFISVVDIVSVILKLKAQDGKYRETDVTDIEWMFHIIESIPSKNAEPIKQWLAHLGKERIDETFDP